MNTQCVQQAKGVNLIKTEKESVPMSTNKPDRTVECATQLSTEIKSILFERHPTEEGSLRTDGRATFV